LAIIKRSESELGSATPAEESIAVQELPAPDVAPQAPEPEANREGTAGGWPRR